MSTEKRDREQRQIERRQLLLYLRVFDGMGSRVIGNLVDISPNGVMLLSDEPIGVNEDYRLRMRLPEEFGDEGEILFNARSRWCKKDVNPNFYLTGFQIQDISSESKRYLASLIDDFGFRQPE